MKGWIRKISGNLCSNFPIPLAQSQVWDVSFVSESLPTPSIASQDSIPIDSFIEHIVHLHIYSPAHSFIPQAFLPECWAHGQDSGISETVTHTLHSRWFTNEWGKHLIHRCYSYARLPCRHHLGLHSRFQRMTPHLRLRKSKLYPGSRRSWHARPRSRQNEAGPCPWC